MKTVTKATFLIPTTDRDGRKLDGEIGRLEADLLGKFKTWSVMTVRGEWCDEEGRAYRDTHKCYSVILNEDDLSQLEVVLRNFKGRKLLVDEVVNSLVTDVTVPDDLATGWLNEGRKFTWRCAA